MGSLAQGPASQAARAGPDTRVKIGSCTVQACGPGSPAALDREGVEVAPLGGREPELVDVGGVAVVVDEEGALEVSVRAVIPAAASVEARAMSLREIFIALARASRLEGK